LWGLNRRHGGRRRPLGDGLVVFLEERQRRRGIEVSGEDEDGVVRRVIGPVIGHDLVAAPAQDVAHPADHVPVIGMGHDGRGPDVFVEDGVVVVLDSHPALRGDDAALGLEDLRRERQSLYAVGFHGDHVLQGGGREPVRVGRQIVRRVGVVRAAAELHGPVELAGTELGRAVEHHVFNKVGDAGEARPFVPRADPEERVQRDVGDVVILDEEDLQAVVELVDLDVGLGEGGAEDGRREKQGRGQSEDFFPHAGTSWEKTHLIAQRAPALKRRSRPEE
jgi:hypothetical protein